MLHIYLKKFYQNSLHFTRVSAITVRKIMTLNLWLRKNLKSAFPSNFNFFGHNSVAHETSLSLVPVNKLQKYLRQVLQKLGTLQFSSPNGLSFKVKKLIVINLKVKKSFLLGLFLTRTNQVYSLKIRHLKNVRNL